MAIRRGTLASYTSDDVCAFVKQYDQEVVFVLSNLRNHAVTYQVPAALANSKWKDAFSGAPVTVSGSLEIAPYAYIVLTK